MAMTKSDIKEKIIAGNPRFVLAYPNKKNDLWTNFRDIHFDNVKLDYVYCIQCKDIITYSSRTGTGGLHRHRCMKPIGARTRTKTLSKLKTVPDIKFNTVMTKGKIKDIINSKDPHLELKHSNTKNHLWENFRIIHYDRIKLDYAYCIKCKDIITYSSRTGTGGLHRHRCMRSIGVRSKIKSDIKPKAELDVTTMTMTKSEIREFMSSEDSRLELQHSNTQNDLWENFRIIHFDNVKLDYAYCIKCKDIITYSSRTGTSGLHRHQCTKVFVPKCETLDSSPKLKVKIVPEKVLQNIARNQLHLVIKDLQPINFFEGDGFLQLAQDLIDIGANYGRQEATNVLKSTKALSQVLLPAEYDAVKAVVKEQLIGQYPAFTIDMWTVEQTQRSFFTLTLHYINNAFDLVVAVLGIREILPEKNSAEDILESVNDILNDFDVDQSLRSEIFVTGNHTNIIQAFQNCERLTCACHNLNVAINDAFQEFNIPQLDALLTFSNNLVSHFKYTGLNNKLSKSLNQHVKTQWNTIFTTFSSILDLQTEIETLLQDKTDENILENIDFSLIKDIVNFLIPFKECSERLSTDNEPVIQEYALWYQKLLNLCTAESDPLESEVMTIIKSSLAKSLNDNFKPTTFHYIALFLNPPFKSLCCLSSEKRNQVIESVKSMLTQIYENMDVNPTTTNNSNTACSNRFEEFFDSTFTTKNQSEVDNQLSMYMNIGVQTYQPILSFWKSQSELYLLQQLVKQIICIPPSSTKSEMVFSTRSRIIEERRHLLNTNLDQILFLNKNMKI